jgi:fructose-1,6-bisphosphatase/inositol monophosphatase family enzyme
LTTIEQEAVDAFRARGELAPLDSSDDRAHAWVRFGLHVALRACAQVRSGEVRLTSGDVGLKPDGSPATQLETDVESSVREALKQFAPDAVLVGEETGGDVPERGTALAIDPVDGTWAFIGGTATYSTTMALIVDGVGTLGIVAAPAAGRITYATAQTARTLQVSAFGEPDTAHDLPANRTLHPVLVNLHPGRVARTTSDALYAAWEEGAVRMVRSPGGSPSLALIWKGGRSTQCRTRGHSLPRSTHGHGVS